MGSPPATVDDARTGQITHDVVDALACGRHYQLLNQWTEHLNRLVVGLNEGGHEPVVPRGGRGRDPARRSNCPVTPRQHPRHGGINPGHAFNQNRAVVHEERVMDELLAADVVDR